MSDRHYRKGDVVPSYCMHCVHCRRPINCFGRKYGSNACRQAAYRLRMAKRHATAQAPGIVTPSVTDGTAARRRREHAPPLEGKTIGLLGRRRTVTPTGKAKGGAA